MENMESKDGIAVAPQEEQAVQPDHQLPPPEAQEQLPEQPCGMDEQYFAQLHSLLDTHFQSIKSAVKFVKEKDENVRKLSAMLETYREGIDATVFKALALNIIPFREDCRKAIRQFETGDLNAQASSKYLKYIYMDFEDVLMNIGIVEKDGKWLYNGKDPDVPICRSEPVPTALEAVEQVEAQVDVCVTDAESLSAYLTCCQEQLRSILANNAAQDKLLAAYIENSGIYEQGVLQAVLYPVVRRIIGLYQKTVDRVNEKLAEVTDENGKQIYLQLLQEMVDRLEEILALCGVSVDGYVSDVHDLKKHKVLKTIPTEDEALHGHVAFRYNDCYMQDDKVIYHQKIDVYKK